MRALATLSVVLALWVGLSPAVSAGAPPRSARKEAAERFQKAVGLYKEGDYGAALAEFKAAYEAAPTWEVLYNIGLTERRLFKYGQAVKTFDRYLEEGGRRVPKDRREDVERELEQIRGLTASVTIKVEGPPARVLIDGESVGQTPLGEPVLVGSGKHTFRAERPGFKPEEQSVEVISRKAITVTLTLKPPEDTLPVDIQIDSSPSAAIITVDGKLVGLAPTKVQLTPGAHEVLADLDGYTTSRTEVLVTPGQARKVTVTLENAAVVQAEGGRRGLRLPVAGLITVGAGLALIGGGVGLAVKAQADGKKVSELFQTGGTWDASAAAVQSSGQAAQTWAWLLLVSGSATLATGIVVSLITMGGEPAEEESAFFFVPTPHGATLGWTVSF